MLLSRLVQTSTRQREIIEILLRHGWDYMRQLLLGNQPEQPQLPPPAILRNILADLGPVYVKLGQLLSTRPDLLPPDYIKALSSLQSDVPPVEWSLMEAVLRQELIQPLEVTFRQIQPEPVAAGSIGQVHRATLQSGEEVALKIQRPDIDQVVDQDILLLKGVAELVSKTDFGQYYDILGLAEEVSNALRSELLFIQEADHTEQLRRNLSNSRWFDPKRLVIPKVYRELTSDRLLVLEWLSGVPLLSADLEQVRPEGQPTPTQGANVLPMTRQEIAQLLLRAFFQQICLDGFFHADPHPGNLLYLDDGRVALLDCGMVGRLDPLTQAILLELILAIVNLDAKRCSQLTLQMAPASEEVNLVRLEADYDRLLRRYYSLSLSELNFSQLFYEILESARHNRVKIPGNLGLCAKALANLEGVGRSLDPEFNLPNEIRPLMADVFRRQLVGDAPLPALLRTVLDLKNLSLRSPRQIEILLDRFSSETLQWNLSLRELEPLRRSLDTSVNRLSFSIVVGSLIIGAAIISSKGQLSQVAWVSDVLFTAATFLGLWLLIKILRTDGR